jgi:hypothetical protein
MYNNCIDFTLVASTQSPVSLRMPGTILLAFNRISSLQPRFGRFSCTKINYINIVVLVNLFKKKNFNLHSAG